MRFIILGAGAVGVTLGSTLENVKHEVIYLVRPGRKVDMTKLILIDAGTEKMKKRERPTITEVGSPVPPFEWVLLCVRTDQIDEAMKVLAEHVRPDVKVGLAAAATPEILARVRAAHPGGPVFTITPVFSAWSEEANVWRWWSPPLLKTLASGEGDPAAQEAAEEFAAALVAGGLPAAAVASAHRQFSALFAPGIALLAGWELVDWDLDALAKDKGLRALTAGAMAEAARAMRTEVEGPARLITYLPGSALSLLLAALPRLATHNARAMWKHHGPKIRLQTRVILDEVLAKPGAGPMPHLRELRARLPA